MACSMNPTTQPREARLTPVVTTPAPDAMARVMAGCAQLP